MKGNLLMEAICISKNDDKYESNYKIFKKIRLLKCKCYHIRSIAFVFGKKGEE